ncbi:50S ribosomal protein L18 [Candidatus Peregrinibacteria bacterium CG11_big_fil_rev_8_21_14_0_20_46_8]|nr:MAG: 50S ribosomal protein L18 [Candidatus Peregrinibacteria bacterium CG11_big_fil_rev_8_21_14_0_20_46_8]
MKNLKTIQRQRRHNRVRGKIQGNAEKPRLVVFRSLKLNYAQLVDDDSHNILAAADDKKLKGKPQERAKQVGEALAKVAKEKGISACVFDRNGYKYHGRVKAVAEGAREGGLKF